MFMGFSLCGWCIPEDPIAVTAIWLARGFSHVRGAYCEFGVRSMHFVTFNVDELAYRQAEHRTNLEVVELHYGNLILQRTRWPERRIKRIERRISANGSRAGVHAKRTIKGVGGRGSAGPRPRRKACRLRARRLAATRIYQIINVKKKARIHLRRQTYLRYQKSLEKHSADQLSAVRERYDGQGEGVGTVEITVINWKKRTTKAFVVFADKSQFKEFVPPSWLFCPGEPCEM